MGQVHGLTLVNGRRVGDQSNPAVWRPGLLVDKQRYVVLISVQIEGDKAKIEVSLDNHPIISWSGKQESLDVEVWWSLPKPYRAALAGDSVDAVFHSALVRATGGKTRMASHFTPTIALNDPHWVDLLKDVNPDRDAIHGWWLRAGSGIEVALVSQAEKHVRLMFPHAVEGSYDLLAEFTRTKGADSVVFAFPVGTRQCELNLSAWAGRSGGLEAIETRTMSNRLNQGLRSPSLSS